MKGKGKLKKAPSVVHCEPDDEAPMRRGGKAGMKAEGGAVAARMDRPARAMGGAINKSGGFTSTPLSMPVIPANKNPKKTTNC